jgi:hypothetical protein
MLLQLSTVNHKLQRKLELSKIERSTLIVDTLEDPHQRLFISSANNELFVYSVKSPSKNFYKQNSKKNKKISTIFSDPNLTINTSWPLQEQHPTALAYQERLIDYQRTRNSKNGNFGI